MRLICNLGRFISEVEGKLQVVEEVVGKFWIHIEDLQKIFSLNGAQVTVTQSSHISVGLSRLGKKMDHLSKNIIFSCWRQTDKASSYAPDIIIPMILILTLIHNQKNTSMCLQRISVVFAACIYSSVFTEVEQMCLIC